MILMNHKNCSDLEKKVLLRCFEWLASYRIILKLIHSAKKTFNIEKYHLKKKDENTMTAVN